MTVPLDLDALDKQHQPPTPAHSWCQVCEYDWPCPTSTLIARVRDLGAQVADWRVALTEVADNWPSAVGGQSCRWCGWATKVNPPHSSSCPVRSVDAALARYPAALVDLGEPT